MAELNQTPRSNRVHIGIFGRRNSGKSSFINCLTKQNIAIVSDVAGTTADPVYKAMEFHPLGPCVFIDTAGFDDEGTLGELRVAKTMEAADKTDIAVLILSLDSAAQTDDMAYEKEWIKYFKERKIPVLPVLNKIDMNVKVKAERLKEKAEELLQQSVLAVSTKTGEGFAEFKEALINIPVNFEQESITGHLIKPGDHVLLVMPQDIQAPKGRLIMPQVQVIRDLLDHKAIPTSVTTECLPQALALFKEPPVLIITDSQVFKEVYALKPAGSKITSFSVLMARYKGDIDEFVAGAQAIDRLQETDRVLIAEACTHNPLDGDIGRIKIPAMLRKIAGPGLKVDVVAGNDFPSDLKPYSLIIHCGACMFNRRLVLSRIMKAREQGVPITNYGIAIAKMAGILDYVEK